MKQTKAFSLVEVLVVIAIILIVTAICVPVVLRVKRSGLEARSVSNMRQLYLALETYRSEAEGSPYGSMEAMGLPLGISTQYLGQGVANLHPPLWPQAWNYYYYPAPSWLDHRVPTWEQYATDKGAETVLLADFCFNFGGPEEANLIHDPYLEKYAIGITLGGSVKKKRASGHLDLIWWDR